MRTGEKGITMVEIIIATALFFVVIPLIWNNINSSIEDSANINNKMLVQTSVNALMNNIQKNVQEASMPITDSPENIECEADSIAEDGEGSGGSIKLLKPGGVVVTYTFDDEAETVKFTMKDKDDNLLDAGGYEHISKFSVEYKHSETEPGVHKVNGLSVTVVGRIDKKSNYTMTNEYYTRNTI